MQKDSLLDRCCRLRTIAVPVGGSDKDLEAPLKSAAATFTVLLVAQTNTSVDCWRSFPHKDGEIVYFYLFILEMKSLFRVYCQNNCTVSVFMSLPNRSKQREALINWLWTTWSAPNRRRTGEGSRGAFSSWRGRFLSWEIKLNNKMLLKKLTLKQYSDSQPFFTMILMKLCRAWLISEWF